VFGCVYTSENRQIRSLNVGKFYPHDHVITNTKLTVISTQTVTLLILLTLLNLTNPNRNRKRNLPLFEFSTNKSTKTARQTNCIYYSLSACALSWTNWLPRGPTCIVFSACTLGPNVELVSWSLTSLFSTNMAISETTQRGVSGIIIIICLVSDVWTLYLWCDVIYDIRWRKNFVYKTAISHHNEQGWTDFQLCWNWQYFSNDANAVFHCTAMYRNRIEPVWQMISEER